MDDSYHQFLFSMSAFGEFTNAPPDRPRQPQFAAAATAAPFSSTYGSYQTLDFPKGGDSQMASGTAKNSRRRRKSAAAGSGAEPVKHRRTRSGCFTCRSRRVKCDETRPICERCRKGNRDCVYPDPPAPKGTASQRARAADVTPSAQHTSPGSSKEDEEGDGDSKLETIYDEDELDDGIPPSASASESNKVSPRTYSEAQTGSEVSSQTTSKTSSPYSSNAISGITAGTACPSTDVAHAEAGQDWSSLSQEYRMYLKWFVENVSHFHYYLNEESAHFITTTLPNIAVQHEPLLNAVVGFSAYLRTLQNPAGKLEDFLHFYNRSVTLLIELVKRNDRYTVPTLLTVLQLATIEEYLGDWVNLMGHQKAAFQMLRKLFKYKTVMHTDVGVACYNWYKRFDNSIALIGGFPTELPREWWQGAVTHYKSQGLLEPEAWKWKYAERRASLHVIAYDMSILFARGSRGQISKKDFDEQHVRLSKRLVEWKTTWDPAFSDPRFAVTDYPQKKPLDPDDIVDPYAPGALYDFPIFNTTLMMVEWHSVMITHQSQASNLPPSQLYTELKNHAYAICQHFEALQFWPETPKGAVNAVLNSIAIAALFLPQDEQHRMWLRRKFAHIESIGYIYPLSLRTRVAELFGDPALERWWLPNDEGFSPILQSIRGFADERNAIAVTAQQESLREIRQIFAKLDLND